MNTKLRAFFLSVIQHFVGRRASFLVFAAMLAVSACSPKRAVDFTSEEKEDPKTALAFDKAVLLLNLAPLYTFADTELGMTTDVTVTMSNYGQGTAREITASGLDSPFRFKGGTYPGTGGTCGSTLAVDASCVMVLQFYPSAVGSYTDRLDINFVSTDDSLQEEVSGYARIYLVGDGTQNQATLTITDSPTYNWGPVALGSAVDRSFTITNTSTSITATDIADLGEIAAPFTYKGGSYPGTGGNCGTTLAAGATCTIILTFSPTTLGAASDTLEIEYNNALATDTLTLNLQGTGALAVLTISDATTYDYGRRAPGSNTQHSFTVTNSGAISATSLADGGGLAAPFSYYSTSYPGTGGNCGSTLAAGASCTIVVNFSPLSATTYSDTIVLNYNNGQSSTSATRDITGEGAVAILSISHGATYDYGNGAIGFPESNVFTVTNSGGLTATSVGDGGGLAAPFNWKGGTYPGTGGTCGSSLNASATCTIVVDFTPTTSGAFSDAIVLSYYNGQSSQTATRAVQGSGGAALLTITDSPTYDFGDVLKNSASYRLFTITNSGTLTANSISDAGALAAPYTYRGGNYPGDNGDCGSSLAASATCTIEIAFSPTAVGNFTDTLVINYNDGAAMTTLNEDLSGDGVLGVLEITDSPLYDFGPILVNQVAERSFTITNTGGYAVSSVADGSGLAAPFRYKGNVYPGSGGNCGTTIAAGATCTIVLQYAPTAMGNHTDTLLINYNDGVGAQSLSLNLEGDGEDPAVLTITDSPTYNYGNVNKNTTADRSFTITNTGGVSATSVADGGGLAAPFNYAGGNYPGTGGNCGTSIAGGATCTIVVRFSPTAITSYSDILLINYNNGASSQQLSENLQGSGINTVPVASDQSVSFAENSTGNAITVVATDANGDSMTYAIVSNPSNGTLGSVDGDNSFTYTPNANYVGSDSFTFRANDGTGNGNTATVTISVFSWWNTAWKNRRKITISNGSIASNLTDFPILIKLNSSRVTYGSTQNSGQDIRFVDSDDTTVLAHEIETWDEAGTSFVWVKVPQIDASSNTDHIYMYYGNTSAPDGQNAATVWSNGFLAVLHMNQSAATHTDSTSSGNHFASSGTVGTGTGMIGGARDFGGGTAGGFITDADGELYFNGLSALTVSMWIKTDTGGTDQGLMRTDNRPDNQENSLHYSATNSRVQSYTLGTSSGTPQGILSSDTKHATSWQHFAYTWASGVSTKHYFNGVLDTPTSTSGSTVTGTLTGADRVEIGISHSIGNRFDGLIDEIRISNVARSADWLKAEELSGSDNSYCSYETEIVIQ